MICASRSSVNANDFLQFSVSAGLGRAICKRRCSPRHASSRSSAWRNGYRRGNHAIGGGGALVEVGDIESCADGQSLHPSWKSARCGSRDPQGEPGDRKQQPAPARGR
jgi:hypothetical protein